MNLSIDYKNSKAIYNIKRFNNKIDLFKDILTHNLYIFQMQKQQQLQQYHGSKSKQYNSTQQQQFDEPQIGTQILDPTLPSDIDFDKKIQIKKQSINNFTQQQQQTKFDNAIPLNQPYRKSSLQGIDLLQSYTIKGKSQQNNISEQPKYQIGKLINLFTGQLIQIKLYDQQQHKSSGFKRLWEAFVGYVKRQISFYQGYFYIFEKKPQGLFVTHCWKLNDLFKIFLDQQENKIRFVFTQDQKIITKDISVKNIKNVMQKLLNQLNKYGLRIQGQTNH